MWENPLELYNVPLLYSTAIELKVPLLLPIKFTLKELVQVVLNK